MSEFIKLNIALLTISDSRNSGNDVSGKALHKAASEGGHCVLEQRITADNCYTIRATVSDWIANANIHAIITTGGTGVTGKDGTPEAVAPLLDKTLHGFGEVFRALSYQDIATSTIQSRAIAGVANGTYIFCLPGSPNACKTAWDKIISAQLDNRTKPCNLVQLMPRLGENDA